VKTTRIAAVLAFVLLLHTFAFANERDAHAISVVDRYVKAHKHWKKADYQIQRSQKEDHFIVFLVTYLPEQKPRAEEKGLTAGGGETFAAYYDPAKQKVIKEMHFQ
jgi:hypothetical protein